MTEVAPPSTWWCEYALVDGAVAAGATIRIADGRFETITIDTVCPPGATKLAGLTLPGFANGHSHAFHRALRSRVQAERGDFWTWRNVMYEAAAKLTPDSYFRLACAVFGEMVLAGMSAVGEFHYLHHQVNGARYQRPNAMGEALLAAATEAGIRITLLDTLYLHGGLAAAGYELAADHQRRFVDGSAEEWRTRIDELQLGPGQQLGAAVHSVRAVDPGSIRVTADWAREHSAPLHAHVSEQRSENESSERHHGLSPTQVLESAGALETNFTAVHATHLSSADIALLGSHASTICLCPTTERDLGDGIGPAPELAAAGAQLCLGSDSHAVVDQMAETRAVELNERLRSEQRGIHRVDELLAMATINGHRSLGWDDAGIIKPGKRADMTTISLTNVRMAGISADVLLEGAVFASTASDITSVVVDGRQHVRNGRHLRLCVSEDLDAAVREVLG